jgi:hypothetical protein
MAFDEGLAHRLREALGDQAGVVERRMFGGLAFMLSGNMCCGVVGETLMVRVGPKAYDAALMRPHARPMDFTGKPLKGLIYVDPPGYESDTDLAGWVRDGVAFARSLPAKR